jgi:hypothetical protein
VWNWSLRLREEHRLRATEKEVSRRMFGSKWEEVTGGWRKAQSVEIHNFYYCSVQIMEDGISGTWSSHGRDKQCIQNWLCGLDSSWSGVTAGSSERGNELSGSYGAGISWVTLQIRHLFHGIRKVYTTSEIVRMGLRSWQRRSLHRTTSVCDQLSLFR